MFPLTTFGVGLNCKPDCLLAGFSPKKAIDSHVGSGLMHFCHRVLKGNCPRQENYFFLHILYPLFFLVVKVSWFQKDFLISSIIPINEQKNSTWGIYLSHTSGRIVFVRFMEDLRKPKSPFEINWPLVTSLLLKVSKFWKNLVSSILLRNKQSSLS